MLLSLKPWLGRPSPAAVLLTLAQAACFAWVVPTSGHETALPADLAGTWVGTMEHDGEQQTVVLHLKAGEGDQLTLALTIPVIHLSVPLGSISPTVEGDSIRLGPFRLLYHSDRETLSGVMPPGLVPVYSLPLRLKKAEAFASPSRPALAGARAEPVWTFPAGTPLWAGPVLAKGVLYIGGEDGSIFAVDARSGIARWKFLADGPIRTRPALAGGTLFAQADDGYLYALDSTDGTLIWRDRLHQKRIERLPFDNPKSRYDRFGSDAVISHGLLYVGTHEGKVIALRPADGRQVWEFAAGDAVLAAPAVAHGRVVFGSYDHSVYALDAKTGRLQWKCDTRGSVVSTPAVFGDRIVVGNRGYDLLGIEARSGTIAWKRYIWMSWVESSPSIRDHVAYVGSSDAAKVFAFDATTGKSIWATDVWGWAWGQPAVTEDRVYMGTSGQVGYPTQQSAGVVALDRARGAVVWRYEAEVPAAGSYGFPGSPAVGSGLVFVGGLDGRLYAFRP